jgi:hypothetical protein
MKPQIAASFLTIAGYAMTAKELRGLPNGGISVK